MVITPITFRSEWCYFMEFGSDWCYRGPSRLIFKGDWCYSSRSRENDLLQNQVKFSENRDFLPKMGF